MSRPAITVENLSKAYHIGLKQDRADTLVGALQGLVRAPLAQLRHMRRMNTFTHQDEADDIYWALKDVSFEVAEGEVVGIIGRNGAGKSTLLKILSRITEPTSGRAIIRGRVSSLLEVGTGFHQELSGRENVYMNGTILGMTKREIDRKFDEIVDFSGVEKFLDTPIKHYSSGMKVRLAFAVAAHLEPEILIVDEVLAVGDMEFQNKCLGKMHEVARGGRTVLFVSHNMAAVESLCNRGIVLQRGQVSVNSNARDAVQAYHHEGFSRTNGEGHRFNPISDVAVKIKGFKLHELCVTSNGNICPEGYSVGVPLEFQLDCESLVELVHPVVCIRIVATSGQVIAECHSLRCGGQLPQRLSGRFAICCELPELLLTPGQYFIRVDLKQQGGWFFCCENAGLLTILPTDFYGTGTTGASVPGIHIYCRQRWTAKSTNHDTATSLVGSLDQSLLTY